MRSLVCSVEEMFIVAFLRGSLVQTYSLTFPDVRSSHSTHTPKNTIGRIHKTVFRTNTSYKRWDEARKNWGMNINHTRDLVRMANTYYDSTGVPPQERQQDLHHVALCTWAFVR
jgi:predicted membrane chloride channel (bestrophin family)